VSVTPELHARLVLEDLTRLYRPERYQSLRQQLTRWGGITNGITNVLVSRDSREELRQRLVAQLRFESVLELACQAGVISSEGLREDENLVSPFLIQRQQEIESAHRWLPALFASRLASRHDHRVPTIDGQEDPAFVFSQLMSLDATIHSDYEVSVLFAELSMPPTLRLPDQTLLEPFTDPQRFVAVMTATSPERGWPSPSLQNMTPGRIGKRVEVASRGLRRFLLFSLELAQLLSRASELRTTVWHYYAGIFDHFTPTYSFARAIRLASSVVDMFSEWNERSGADAISDEQVQRTLARYRDALDRLNHDEYEPPAWWRVAAGGPDTDTPGGSGSGAVLPPLAPAPAGPVAPRLPVTV
jgi:hypothetical protein